MTRSITVDSRGSGLADSELFPAADSSSVSRALWTDERRVRVTFTLPRVNIVIEGPRQEPNWFYPSLNAFKDLSRLPPGWDSYGGRQIADMAIAGGVRALVAVLGLLDPQLSAPDIVPTSDGGLQLEWHRGGAGVELRISPTGGVSAFFRDPATNASGDIASVGKPEFQQLAQIVSRI